MVPPSKFRKRNKLRVRTKKKDPLFVEGKRPRPMYVDYKDIDLLKKLINRHGRIVSRRKTGCTAVSQHAVTLAIKRARFMALLPYTGDDVAVPSPGSIRRVDRPSTKRAVIFSKPPLRGESAIMAGAFRTQRRVEFCETDAAGIVHFAEFFPYMEQAEHAMLRHLGLSVVFHDDQGVISWPRIAPAATIRGRRNSRMCWTSW